MKNVSNELNALPPAPKKRRKRVRVGSVINAIVLVLLALMCLLPLLYVLAVSLSSDVFVNEGEVSLMPRGFTFVSYKYVLGQNGLWVALGRTVLRCVLGVSINVLMCILCAYPLSKRSSEFKWRGVYVWFFFITILFGAPLVPWYFVISTLGMIDTIWALVLPGAVPVFSMIILLNFFKGIPGEICEAAEIDGAGPWRILFGFYVPLSLPSIMTVILFAFVFHWNSWFDGMLLMNSPEKLPLQSYVQSMLNMSNADFYMFAGSAEYAGMNIDTYKCATTVVTLVPIVIIYSFLQKGFTKGLTIGSVKG